MFEHYKEPILPRHKFLVRMLEAAGIGASMFVVTITLGVFLFCGVEHETFIDGMLNSVMVMTGLGLVKDITTQPGKVFLAGYALLSAVVFFSVLAILFSPLLHRLLHRLHLEDRNKD